MKADGKHTVLIVEDDNEIANCYFEFLRDNYDVEIISSGVKAIELIKRREDVDLVILDHKLSDILGIEVLRQIKECKPQVPVVLVTAYGDENLAIKSFRYGARDYIKKPFSFCDLAKKIDFFLSLKNGYKNSSRNAHVLELHSEESINGAAAPLRYNHKMQKAISFINENCGSKIELDLVANYVGMSRYHFSKVFRRMIGITFQEYLNNKRIEKAKVLLRENAGTITDIAFAVGYEDLTHFGRMFKRAVGSTPSQFKRRSPA